MEKQSPYQLELFTGSAEGSGLKPAPAANPFFSFVRSYEKTILVIIGVVALSVVSYGLGVEKGKKMSVSKFSNAGFDVADASLRQSTAPVAPVAQRVVPAEPQPMQKEAIRIEEKPPVSAPKFLEKQGYVIQLASYKNRSLADKEAQALKKKGLSPVVMPKGSYMVLCVGNIANKEIALSLLPELKKRYKDCYVRRL